MADITNVPDKGTRWLYDGKPVVVHSVQTTVSWSYEDDPDPFQSVKSAELHCFTRLNNPSFTPLPDKIEPGTVYIRVNNALKEFFVYEHRESNNRIYGRERLGPEDNWYAYDYGYELFKTSFVLEEENPWLSTS